MLDIFSEPTGFPAKMNEERPLQQLYEGRSFVAPSIKIWCVSIREWRTIMAASYYKKSDL